MKRITTVAILLLAQTVHANDPIFVVKKVGKLKSFNNLLIRVENKPAGMPRFTYYRDSTKTYQVGDTLKLF